MEIFRETNHNLELMKWIWMMKTVWLWKCHRQFSCESNSLKTGTQLKSQSIVDGEWEREREIMYVSMSTAHNAQYRQYYTFINNLKPPLNNNHHKCAIFIYLCVCGVFFSVHLRLAHNFFPSFSMLSMWCPIQYQMGNRLFDYITICWNKCVNVCIVCTTKK